MKILSWTYIGKGQCVGCGDGWTDLRKPVLDEENNVQTQMQPGLCVSCRPRFVPGEITDHLDNPFKKR